MFTPCGIAYLLPATPMNIRGWLQGIWDSSLQQGCIFRKGLFAIPDHPSSNPASPGPNRGLTSPEDIWPYPKAAPQKKQKASQAKKCQSAILTDTPDKESLEEERKQRKRWQNDFKEAGEARSKKEKTEIIDQMKKTASALSV